MFSRSALQSIKKMIEPVRRLAMLTITRIVVKAIADDTGLQKVKAQIFADFTKSEMERMQNYGFTSVPLEGAEGIAVFPGGNMDHGIVIAVDDRRYRLKGLLGGEVALYTDEGDYIKLARGRIIDVVTQTLNITATEEVNISTKNYNVSASEGSVFETPNLQASEIISSGGNMACGGALAAVGNMTLLTGTTPISMEDFRTIYNTHRHNENGTGGGITDPTTNTI